MAGLIEPYPLRWPFGRPRTPPERRREAEIESTFALSVRRVMQESRLLRSQGATLTLNVPLGPNRTPLDGHGEGQPEDTGAALYFGYEGKRHCIAADCWYRVEDNIQAIALAIEVIRRLRRIGGPAMEALAIAGFAVGGLEQGGGESWWNILGVPFDAPLYAAEQAYRDLVLTAHPDRGGTAEAMVRLNLAIGEARQQLREPRSGSL